MACKPATGKFDQLLTGIGGVAALHDETSQLFAPLLRTYEILLRKNTSGPLPPEVVAQTLLEQLPVVRNPASYPPFLRLLLQTMLERVVGVVDDDGDGQSLTPDTPVYLEWKDKHQKWVEPLKAIPFKDVEMWRTRCRNMALFVDELTPNLTMKVQGSSLGATTGHGMECLMVHQLLRHIGGHITLESIQSTQYMTSGNKIADSGARKYYHALARLLGDRMDIFFSSCDDRQYTVNNNFSFCWLRRRLEANRSRLLQVGRGRSHGVRAKP